MHKILIEIVIEIGIRCSPTQKIVFEN